MIWWAWKMQQEKPLITALLNPKFISIKKYTPEIVSTATRNWSRDQPSRKAAYWHIQTCSTTILTQSSPPGHKWCCPQGWGPIKTTSNMTHGPTETTQANLMEVFLILNFLFLYVKVCVVDKNKLAQKVAVNENLDKDKKVLYALDTVGKELNLSRK